MSDGDSRSDVGATYLVYQRTGEKYLQEQRWDLAQHALDEALARASHDTNKNSSALIQILDLRVETQLRLQNLDAATKDARAMVRHNRADPRGYLRCGQLGRLKNDYAGAQKWYAQGLKNVSKANEAFHKLETMNSKTICKMTAPRNQLRDPLSFLPMDLIHIVFDYLEFWEATSCLRVSKTWRNTLLATHSIWKTFDLLGSRKPVSQKSVKACIRRLPSPPTTVRLNKLTASAMTYLQPYLERWTTIENLTINIPQLMETNCGWALSTSMKTVHFGKQCPIYFDMVEDLLHCCDKLKKARFDAVLRSSSPRKTSPLMVEHYRRTPRKTSPPELTHLELTQATESDQPQKISPSGLFRDFPNLMDLRCKGLWLADTESDMSTASCLHHLELEDLILTGSFRLPDSLEVLIVKAVFLCGQTRSPIQVMVPPIAPSPSTSDEQATSIKMLRNLKVLELKIVETTVFFQMLLNSPSATLTKMNVLTSDMDLSDMLVLLKSGKLANLTDLRLSPPFLTDDHMQSVATHCPLLEYVELHGSKITGVSIKALCICTAVKTLKLWHCLDISGDAIEWARARGVTVMVNQMPEPNRMAGRRVRYD